MDALYLRLLEAASGVRTLLDLSNSGIGDAGATALAQALKVNGTVTVLDLSKNCIDQTGVAALAEALNFNCTLSALGLGDFDAESRAELFSIVEEQPARARQVTQLRQRQRVVVFCWSSVRRNAFPSLAGAQCSHTNSEIGCLPANHSCARQ